jgi:hypothetical protein
MQAWRQLSVWCLTKCQAQLRWHLLFLCASWYQIWHPSVCQTPLFCCLTNPEKPQFGTWHCRWPPHYFQACNDKEFHTVGFTLFTKTNWCFILSYGCYITWGLQYVKSKYKMVSIFIINFPIDFGREWSHPSTPTRIMVQPSQNPSWPDFPLGSLQIGFKPSTN